MHFYGIPPFLLWLAIIVYGLALGSFATCVIYRMPRDLPVMAFKGKQSRSFCPSCGHILAGRDLIPVVSWVLQKGHCRYCSKPIGARYILIELEVLFVTLMLAGVFGFSIKTFFLAALIPLLAGVAAKKRGIPRS